MDSNYSVDARSAESRIIVGDWELQPNALLITRNGSPTKLSPRAMDVLVYLADRAGEAVTHEELLAAFWRGPISSPNSVHKSVAELRRALEDDPHDAKVIGTVPKRGYRLIAPVTRKDAAIAQQLMTSGDKYASDVPVKRPRRRGMITFLSAAATVAFVAGAVLLPGRMPGAVNSANGQSSASTPASKKSIAVLRFQNTADMAHEYLGEGIANAIAEGLKRVPEVKVADRDHAFQHSLANETVQQIGTALGVDTVLEGNVQALGDRLRVTATLFRATDGEKLYSYTHDESIDQILAIQEKVASSVLSALEIQLDAKRLADMRCWGTKNVDAYLAVMEGDYLHHQLDQRSMRYAADRMRRAIALDPSFAAAYVVLAEDLTDLAYMSASQSDRSEILGEVSHLRETLAQIDPTAEQLNEIRIDEARLSHPGPWDVEIEVRLQIQSEHETGRPGICYMRYSDLLAAAHLFREAAEFLEVYERAVPSDTFAIQHRTGLAWLTQSSYRGISLLKQNLNTFPNDIGRLTALVAQLAKNGDYAEAESYLVRLRDIDSDGLWAYASYLQLGALRGDLPVHSEKLKTALADRHASPLSRGIVQFILGDVDSGIAEWHRMDGQSLAVATTIVPPVETLFPAAVLADDRYQDLLDGIVVGRKFTAHMRAMVADLAPITGIQPSDPSPQTVASR